MLRMASTRLRALARLTRSRRDSQRRLESGAHRFRSFGARPYSGSSSTVRYRPAWRETRLPPGAREPSFARPRKWRNRSTKPRCAHERDRSRRRSTSGTSSRGAGCHSGSGSGVFLACRRARLAWAEFQADADDRHRRWRFSSNQPAMPFERLSRSGGVKLLQNATGSRRSNVSRRIVWRLSRRSSNCRDRALSIALPN